MKKGIIIGILAALIIISIFSVIVGQQIYEGRQPDLGSYSAVHFAGYLFFLIMPVEGLVPFYLSQGHDPLIIFILALVTALFAQIIDYAIGYLTPLDKLKEWLGEKKYNKTRKIINKYGGRVIFFFNLLPISSPIIVAVAGVVGYPLRKTMLYSFYGLSIKYILIIILSTVLFTKLL